MFFKFKEKFFFKSLKWRISLVLILILSIVLVSLGITIYHYASGIVKEQVNEKIRLVSNNYKDCVNNLIADIDEQLDRIVTDDAVYNYFEILLILYPGEDAGEAEMENFFVFMDTMANAQYTTANQLDRLINRLDYSQFAYATLAD
ncbi:MAG: hypothetical protein WBK22_06080, partial [Halanaerobiales bacterium]